MDKELFEYFNKTVNVARASVMISREEAPTGYQFIVIKDCATGDELYSFWHNPNKVVKKEAPPKHTGGKKPYLMLIIETVDGLRKTGVKNAEELIGYLVCLGNNIEWGTGKLIHKRSKKALQYKDLQEAFNCGNKKLNSLLRTMKENDLLLKTEEGYFISSTLIRKGKQNEQR